MKAQVEWRKCARSASLSSLYGEIEETGMIQANLGNSYFRERVRKQWARADEMEAQRGARPSPEKTVLQKSLRPKPCDGVDYRLPLENPAGHREANCRIE
jgi:hypothetical protein